MSMLISSKKKEINPDYHQDLSSEKAEQTGVETSKKEFLTLKEVHEEEVTPEVSTEVQVNPEQL